MLRFTTIESQAIYLGLLSQKEEVVITRPYYDIVGTTAHCSVEGVTAEKSN